MMKRALITSIGLFLVLGLATPSTWAQYGERSTRDQTLIIAGGTAAGAVIGGMAGGQKGALAGAIAGGAGSAIYNQATKEDPYYRGERTGRDKALIIGGGAGAGAVAGGIMGGTKGAIIGAGIGAAGGYILHKKTDNPDPYYRDRYYERDRYYDRDRNYRYRR
jgi:hypothetical protein